MVSTAALSRTCIRPVRRTLAATPVLVAVLHHLLARPQKIGGPGTCRYASARTRPAVQARDPAPYCTHSPHARSRVSMPVCSDATHSEPIPGCVSSNPPFAERGSVKMLPPSSVGAALLSPRRPSGS